MAPLGPFEPCPHLAVAVSGGADSLACAVLAQDWACARHGRVTGLVVDHGLRPAAAAEAHLTAERLNSIGVAAEILPLPDLLHGPALAERARQARYNALQAACAARGILHLLLGHHAADQAETVAQRLLDRSGPDGLAGMAAVVELRHTRLLRPLLTTPPAALRDLLRARSLPWVDDPSNTDPHARRNRLRLLRADADGCGPATSAAAEAASMRAAHRAGEEAAAAAWLGRHARLHPEGFAILDTTPPPRALAGLLRAIAGAAYPPAAAALAAWCDQPRPATLAGVRILPAGRLAPGLWLLVREAAAMAPDAPFHPGARWDNRFRVTVPSTRDLPSDLAIGALGPAAAALRRRSALPSAVLQTLPALRRAGRLFAVPHLGYHEGDARDDIGVLFDPAAAAAGAPFSAPVAGDSGEGFAQRPCATYLS